jgi:hypothetical protein
MLRALIIIVSIAIFAATITGCGPHKQSAIETSIEWARLAPLPVPTREVAVETFGSPFTREFRLSFHLSEAQLEQWLSECEGISDAKIFQEGVFTRYAIRPGGGAQFAEVRVNRSTGEVVVRTYWS